MLFRFIRVEGVLRAVNTCSLYSRDTQQTLASVSSKPYGSLMRTNLCVSKLAALLLNVASRRHSGLLKQNHVTFERDVFLRQVLLWLKPS
jgi:hypothetical protein